MNYFYIITNSMKDTDYAITDRIITCLEAHGKKCFLYEGGEVPGHMDCALVLGGDGTFIQASRKLLGMDVPMLGINMGTLGYLTEVEVQNVESAIEQLIEGRYAVEERMMLYGSVAGGTSDVALNDIVVGRNGSLKILHFNLYVNGEYLNSYQADGVVISTPTGSTAYNLSAGGPIVEPTASLILVTPICSHALNSSSIVFSDQDEIEIEIGSRRDGTPEEAAITFDGTDITTIRTGDRVRVKKSRDTAKIIKLSKISFLETLREKMKGN
ncbi:NAD(+)/NADH kinase [Roseburia hominis]